MDAVGIVAEILAFLSGVLLLRPALRVNGVLRESAELRAIMKQSVAEIDQKAVPVIIEQLESIGSSWNRWDDRCLKAGALLFVLSGLVKVILVCIEP